MRIHKAGIIIVSILVVAVSCQRGSGSTSTSNLSEQLSYVAGNDSLALVAIPVRDTVSAGDPVHIFVGLRAYGEPVSVSNHPDRYSFSIRTPRGDTLVSEPVVYESGLYGTDPVATVPRQGVVGQVLDLKCVQPMYGGKGIPERPCMLKYGFSEMGAYEITARFEEIQAPSGPRPRRLASRPMTIMVR